jgi:homoserine kinase
LTPPGPAAAVAVPASSANLGPGFDALAVALDRYLVAAAGPVGDRRVLPLGEGAGELPTGEDNLVWRALVAYCDRVGAPVPDVSLTVRNEIPLERGMGSSAAAAVAGVALGRELVGGGARDADLVALAAELEGHPDNAAAAVLGGLVVVAAGTPRRLEPSDTLRPVVCVPAQRQGTDEARALLPAQIPLADAAANGARAALVLAGLAGATAWDPAAMTDVLHEPARLAAMPQAGTLVGALRDAGIGACLSGAGPSVLAVVPNAAGDHLERIRDLAADGWQVWPLRWDRSGATRRP